MKSAVCTLFEGHYHYGVAALVNSLFSNGYCGSVYAGYNGDLPNWASAASENNELAWPGASTLLVAKGLQIHFLPLQTVSHLANYKPYFMLELLEGPAKETKALAYFDPDIVVKCKWSFFENWMNYGVAVVHEIASDPMPASHPVRLAWHEVITKCNKQVVKKLDHYFNSGFCGLTKENVEFLKTWCQLLDTGEKYFDLRRNSFLDVSDRTYHFMFADQDAFNMAAMCSGVPISEVGPDGMDFTPGGWVMAHATGSPKPWKKQYFLSALKGIKPTRAEKAYWVFANGPIVNYTTASLKYKKLSVSLAAAVGRFYSRS